MTALLKEPTDGRQRAASQPYVVAPFVLFPCSGFFVLCLLFTPRRYIFRSYCLCSFLDVHSKRPPTLIGGGYRRRGKSCCGCNYVPRCRFFVCLCACSYFSLCFWSVLLFVLFLLFCHCFVGEGSRFFVVSR